MKSEILIDLKKKYKNYKINDEIDDIVNELLESDIDFSKINKNYKKSVIKMEIEDEPLNYCKCMARAWKGGFGGQCSRKKIKGSKFCNYHQMEEQRWCGLITEKRKQEIYPPLTDSEKEINYIKKPHKWRN